MGGGSLGSDSERRLAEKVARLRGMLGQFPGALVAFSGGVDSTFLLHECRQILGEHVLAVTASSPIHPEEEVERARRLAQETGVAHLVLATSELDLPGFCSNPADRCYLCKRALLGLLWEVARSRGIPCVLEGSNASDRAEYRPGLRAVAETGARSPLQEAGLTKGEIRELSRRAGLPTWDLPPMACLATRFPYGTPITPAALAAVAGAERALRGMGFGLVRVRYHGTVARIEVPGEEMGVLLARRDQVVQAVKAAGFPYVALDLQGYRTGSMDEVLARGQPGYPGGEASCRHEEGGGAWTGRR
ncbi:MAG: ATP-dependent sacrificial sulfur transferase LarE [Bacillota bacterium]